MSRKGQRIIAGAASVAVLICALSLDYVRETLNQQAAALPLAVIEDDVNIGSDRQNTATRRIRNATTSAAVVTTTGQVLTNTTIVESAKYVSVAEFPALLSVVSNLTSIVGNHLDDSESNSSGEEENDRQFIYKQVDAIYDSLSDSADDTQEDISALTASVDDLEDDVASLTASLTGLAFVQGGNAFGATTTLGTTDNQPLSLITNGAERLIVTEDGKVGIGTTTPFNTLHVTSNVLNAAGFSFIEDGVLPNASALFENTATPAVGVDPAAFAVVGLGLGGDNGYGGYFAGSATGINASAYNNAATDYAYAQLNGVYSSAQGKNDYFYGIDAVGVGAQFISDDGMGHTASRVSSFNAYSVIGAEGAGSIATTTSFYGFISQLRLAADAGVTYVANAYGVHVANPEKYLVNGGTATLGTSYGVYIAAQTTGNENWNIYSVGATAKNYFAGNVNIGTTATNTSSKLTVVSTNVASTTLRLESPRVAIVSGNILGGIDFASNDSNLTAVSGTTTASILARANETHTASALGTDLIFSTTNGTTTAERLRILGGGNVGIGTSTPSEMLTVAGNGRFTAVSSGAQVYDLNLTADGTLTTSASDRTLKTQEELLDTANTLEKILALQPKSFIWKETNAGDVGLIAQEVAEVFPEIVFTNPVDGYMGINYSRLPALLIAGVQELAAKISELFARDEERANEIERLQNQNEVLNARVEALEDALDIEIEPEEEETPIDTGGGDDPVTVQVPTGDETPVEPVEPPTSTEPEEPASAP